MTTAEITREELVGCWKITSTPSYYIWLREDGTARMMNVWRGPPSELSLEIDWRHIKPDALELVARGAGGRTPKWTSEYRLKYFKGKTVEWWEVRHNDRVTENVMLTQPICWQRTKLLKSWQGQ